MQAFARRYVIRQWILSRGGACYIVDKMKPALFGRKGATSLSMLSLRAPWFVGICLPDQISLYLAGHTLEAGKTQHVPMQHRRP